MSALSSKLKEPSILLAGPNCHRLVRNLTHLLDATSIQLLRDEIDNNVKGLLALGSEQFDFARQLDSRQWRQRVSRLYYAALNTKRGVSLHHSGTFHTDVTDHKNIGALPDDFPNSNTYATRLVNLRDDRNLADYSHLAEHTELILDAREAQEFVSKFIGEARTYLVSRGLRI